MKGIMNKRDISRRMELGFDLSLYLVKHPAALEDITEDKIVIFCEGDTDFNKKSSILAEKFWQDGQSIIKAVRKKTKYNKWNFDLIPAEQGLVATLF